MVERSTKIINRLAADRKIVTPGETVDVADYAGVSTERSHYGWVTAGFRLGEEQGEKG